jgi:hypothetical protein
VRTIIVTQVAAHKDEHHIAAGRSMVMISLADALADAAVARCQVPKETSDDYKALHHNTFLILNRVLEFLGVVPHEAASAAPDPQGQGGKSIARTRTCDYKRWSITRCYYQTIALY